MIFLLTTFRTPFIYFNLVFFLCFQYISLSHIFYEHHWAHLQILKFYDSSVFEKNRFTFRTSFYQIVVKLTLISSIVFFEKKNFLKRTHFTLNLSVYPSWSFELTILPTDIAFKIFAWRTLGVLLLAATATPKNGAETLTAGMKNLLYAFLNSLEYCSSVFS